MYKKKAFKLEIFVIIDVLVSSSSCFRPLLHMVIVLNHYHVPFCYDLHSGSYKIKVLGMLLRGGLFISRTN